MNKQATIFFSKDRALQLHAALQSFFLHCEDPKVCKLFVIFKSTTRASRAQYKVLEREFSEVSFLAESNFSSQLRRIINKHFATLFVVDDCIFVRSFSLEQCAQLLRKNPKAIGISLRLGKNINYCYPMRQKQRVPKYKKLDTKFITFDWTKSEFDFGYPLEVSSSMYRRRELSSLLSKFVFKTPNTLEAGMYEHRGLFEKSLPTLISFERSVAFCNPINIVQSVFPKNRAGKRVIYSVDALQQLFDLGKRIDVKEFSDHVPRGCHEETKISFIG